MAAYNKSREQWKAEGDKLYRAKEFYKAIECYDQALRQTTNESDALILLLNRCQARVSSQHYDSALEDATAVLKLSPGNEKALFRRAKALYGLRRYKESADQFCRMIKLYPENKEAANNFQCCRDRMREESGQFDFKSMLDEAISKSPTPDMDRADYIGPIEVRRCAIKSHGRGVFTTKAIQAGELILVEKAFCSAYVHDPGARSDDAAGLGDDRSLPELKSNLATSTFVKLNRNPSLIPSFADLYPGPDAIEEISENDKPVMDDAFVQNRIMYNAFAFPVLSKHWQWRVIRDVPSEEDVHDKLSSVGVYLKASYINHSCYPTVRRAFIGDMMIWRAHVDIAPNTELKFGYIPDTQTYAGRQEALRNYGFTCECKICDSEITTPPEKIKDRDMIMLKIVQHFIKPTITDIETYFNLIDQVASTYIFPPSQEPRRTLILPISSLIEVCKAESMIAPLLKLGIILLHGLGFELDVTLTSWRIKTWGFMSGDDVLPVLVDLWQACGNLQPRLCEGLERDLKTAYTIMAGEVESFEGMYGSSRPKNLEENLRMMEEMDMQEMATLRGLETVGAMVQKMHFHNQEGGRMARLATR